MSRLRAVNEAPNPQHARKGNGLAEMRCPYCGQRISKDEFEKVRSRIEADARALVGKMEAELKQRLDRERRQMSAKARAETEKAKKDATAQVERVRKEGAAREASIRQEATKAAAAALAPKIAEEVAAEKQRAFAERLALEQQLRVMQSRLEAKPPHQVGEPAEQDLHARLSQLFPPSQMKVHRVPKGARGPDLFLDVLEGDGRNPIGRIAVECKQHARWSNRFVTKLRTDSEGVDFAILSSTVMPAAAKGSRLHVEGVIIAHPTLVPALVILLRKQIIEAHRLKLTTTARDQKAEKLLAYIVSPGCSGLFDRIVKLTDEAMALDRGEIAAHEKVWSKRSDLNQSLRSVYEAMAEGISRIIGSAAEAAP
jgi:hypothetical protein